MKEVLGAAPKNKASGSEIVLPRFAPHFSANSRCALVFVFASLGLSAALTARADIYRYKLELGRNVEVCQHMGKVYNSRFTHLWEYTLSNPPGPSFPLLTGTSDNNPSGYQIGLFLSRYPDSPEFNAIDWRVGSYQWNLPDSKKTIPILVARFDIDNDGKPDTVLKTSLMLSVEPAESGAPGGNDELFILDENQFPIDRPLRPADLYGHPGSVRPARISFDLLHIAARSIRPFIYKRVTYLSIYDQHEFLDSKGRRDQMWIMKYRAGGSNLGGGKWSALETESVCRFKMIVKN
jgi:hypothetical protein